MSTETPATRALREIDLRFELIRTERPKSAAQSAAFQGIELGQLLRTIVVRLTEGSYVFVLVPGGHQIDWPKLRASLGVKRMSLPDAAEAKAVTGYERGAITPFGASDPWPVIADASILRWDRVAIGGGAHGVNVHVAPADLVRALDATVVDIAGPNAATSG
jgi:Cys-tRNA(Pro)/Cys-tRNA(Cys) deacylase